MAHTPPLLGGSPALLVTPFRAKAREYKAGTASSGVNGRCYGRPAVSPCPAS